MLKKITQERQESMRYLGIDDRTSAHYSHIVDCPRGQHSTYPNPKMIGITIKDPLEGIHETMWLLCPVLNNRLVGKQSKDSH